VKERVTLYDDLHPVVVQHERLGGPPELESPKYEAHVYPKVTTEIPPYDWSEREKGVMRRMPNVLRWVQPFGSTIPYEKSHNSGDASRELAWLIKTQHMDIAPQWAEFAANGLKAGSLQNAENGAEENIGYDELDFSQALAEKYTNGRRERWAMERDYQTWHTTPVRRLDVTDLPDGKCTARARWGSEFTFDELRAAIKRHKAAKVAPAPEPITFEWEPEQEWLDELEHDAHRDTSRIADEKARYDEDREEYASGAPCPMQEITMESIQM